MARSTSRPTRLAEEASAAAQSMAEQARALREAVAVFTTPDADAWHAR
ncbi:hypothetical protein [Paraburkholderia azotifigens]|uniref:Methyl-accepting chemotaxis protein n=1 Tax=Paraburkholderia azotifigens TaxID=2057004 RepID=A0ABU9R6V9_9BURK|nr:hypothetical protein [Paraburkholderia azotifigens]